MLLDREIPVALMEGDVSHHQWETSKWRDDVLDYFGPADHPLIKGANAADLAGARRACHHPN